jgi:nicotinamide riboside kinase
MKIALLGAESTGKTQLSLDLAQALRATGRTVAVVPEYLREWCEQAGRTPQPQEQLSIAQEHERRVDAAVASGADIVIADTTAVMVAIYSAMLFDDGTLYRFALERQRGYEHTLVTGLDLPWVADGLQRDGPHVRPPVDALVRAALQRAGVRFQVVYGHGPQRLKHALCALGLATHPGGGDADYGRWLGSCDKCSDPGCEHRLFSSLARRAG